MRHDPVEIGVLGTEHHELFQDQPQFGRGIHAAQAMKTGLVHVVKALIQRSEYRPPKSVLITKMIGNQRVLDARGRRHGSRGCRLKAMLSELDGCRLDDPFACFEASLLGTTLPNLCNLNDLSELNYPGFHTLRAL